MVKVLIYSSKEIYDKSSYEGRAEAHIIAYAEANGYEYKEYKVVKDRTGRIGLRTVFGSQSMRQYIRQIEDAEWKEELEKQNREVEEHDPLWRYKDPSQLEYYRSRSSTE